MAQEKSQASTERAMVGCAEPSWLREEPPSRPSPSAAAARRRVTRTQTKESVRWWSRRLDSCRKSCVGRSPHAHTRSVCQRPPEAVAHTGRTLAAPPLLLPEHTASPSTLPCHVPITAYPARLRVFLSSIMDAVQYKDHIAPPVKAACCWGCMQRKSTCSGAGR